jgi:hypothetical protein
MDWWSNQCGINSQYIFFSSYTYSVSALGSAPSGSTGLPNGNACLYLGNFYKPSIDSVVQTSGTAQVTINIGTAGIYLFTFCIQLYGTTMPPDFYMSMSGTNIFNNTAYGYGRVNGNNYSSQGSLIVNCTASIYSLIININGGTGMTINTQSYFQAIRIG